jgi:hypothetical protein
LLFLFSLLASCGGGGLGVARTGGNAPGAGGAAGGCPASADKGTVSITYTGTPGGVGRLSGSAQATPSGAVPEYEGPLDLVVVSVVTASDIVRTI